MIFVYILLLNINLLNSVQKIDCSSRGQSAFPYAMSTITVVLQRFFLSTDLLHSVRVSKPKQIYAHPDCNPWSRLVLSSSVLDRATAKFFCAFDKLDEPALPNIGASGQ